MKKPGFIDIQVNGYKGIDFSSPDLTIDNIRTAARELGMAGTTAFCPTLITGPVAAYENPLRVIAQAMRDPELKHRILGIHLEGPFISPLEGARGAHPLQHIIPPSVEIFKRLQNWADGNIKIITLAPEMEGATPLIRHAFENGTVVALGHHMAGRDELKEAVLNGARACTHLGNGLPDMINRHRNPLWWELACDELAGIFITDGHHLPPDFIKVALRAKTASRFIVVSDAVRIAGLPPGEYEMSGAKITLATNGRISFKNTPYLAGSSATMLECMNYLSSLELLDEEDLWRAGFDNPLRLLGKNTLPPGSGGTSVVFKEGRFLAD